jgi:hypothetical protein
MASLPTLKAHKVTISCGKIGASFGREAKQAISHKVVWFWGGGALKMGVSIGSTQRLALSSANKTSKYTA